MNERVGRWWPPRWSTPYALAPPIPGDARVKSDTDINEADIAQHNLVLWGDPQSNQVLARIANRLPIMWTKEGVT